MTINILKPSRSFSNLVPSLPRHLIEIHQHARPSKSTVCSTRRNSGCNGMTVDREENAARAVLALLKVRHDLGADDIWRWTGRAAPAFLRWVGVDVAHKAEAPAP